MVFKDGVLSLIDQRLLPHSLKWIECRNEDETAKAIRDMVVRGAPAIGVAAAYGMAMATNPDHAANTLKGSRPTAVDLFNAVEYMLAAISKGKNPLECAIAWKNSIEESTRKISEKGATLLPDGSRVLLHCNAGPLATTGYGTSLGAVLMAVKKKKIFVYVDETRPRCQGALTSYELSLGGVNHKVIADTAAGSLIHNGFVDAVLVGADRVVSNGDFANKIGTYPLAVLCKENNIPFYVLAPLSTFDFSIKEGKDIVIEERDENEILQFGGTNVYAKDTRAFNSAFDVTPAKYVTRYVTELGVLDKISGNLRTHKEKQPIFQKGR